MDSSQLSGQKTSLQINHQQEKPEVQESSSAPRSASSSMRSTFPRNKQGNGETLKKGANPRRRVERGRLFQEKLETFNENVGMNEDEEKEKPPFEDVTLRNRQLDSDSSEEAW